VDDEWAVRAYVARVLQQEGFEVLEAADGLDALSLLPQIQGSVEVLITDVKMPRMTGIELVRNIKTKFPGIAVVYISAEHLAPELHNPSGRVVFLQKPFRPEEMLQAVQSVSGSSAQASTEICQKLPPMSPPSI
jgi:CheY-like chemotaxis protein